MIANCLEDDQMDLVDRIVCVKYEFMSEDQLDYYEERTDLRPAEYRAIYRRHKILEEGGGDR